MSDLQIDEQPDFQRRQWRWQQIGWVVFAVILVAALLGAFGNGPLSASTSHSADDTLTVAWERIVRRQGLSELTLTVAPEAVVAGEVTVWLDPATASQVERVSPEPSEVETGADRMRWTFAADPADGPVTIVFDLTPTDLGPNTVRLGIEAGAELEIRQIVLP